MVTFIVDFSQVGYGGIREKVEATPNTLLSEILKQAWVQAQVRVQRNPVEPAGSGPVAAPPLPPTWTLFYGHRLLDLSLPARLSGLPGNARVDAVERSTHEQLKLGRTSRARPRARAEARPSQSLSIAVHFEGTDGGRFIVSASPEETLWDVLLRADSERIWRYRPFLLTARYLESAYDGVAHFQRLRLTDLGLTAGMRPLVRIQCSCTDDDSGGWETVASTSTASAEIRHGDTMGAAADQETQQAIVQDHGSISDAASVMRPGNVSGEPMLQPRESGLESRDPQMLQLQSTSSNGSGRQQEANRPGMITSGANNGQLEAADTESSFQNQNLESVAALVPIPPSAATLEAVPQQDACGAITSMDADAAAKPSNSPSAGWNQTRNHDVESLPTATPYVETTQGEQPDRIHTSFAPASGRRGQDPTSMPSTETLRQARFYRPASTPIDGRLLELPESFYDLTPEELHRILQAQQRKREEAVTLQLRGAANSQRTMRPPREKCTIRFRLPDRSIIEGQFWCDEKLTDMYDFVRQCLEDVFQPDGAFALYQTPPKRLLRAMPTTLHDARLCPATVLVVVPSVAQTTMESLLRPEYRARLERSPQEAAFAREIAQAAALRGEWDDPASAMPDRDTTAKETRASATSRKEEAHGLTSMSSLNASEDAATPNSLPDAPPKPQVPRWWRPHRS